MSAEDNYLLLVDDDEVAHFLNRRVLQTMGVERPIEEAVDGAAAVDVIDRRGPPSLILLDIRMPGMDGHEFLEWLSLQENFAPPPVLMLTSSNLPSDTERAMAHAFVFGYSEKPLRVGALESAGAPVQAALGVAS